MDRLAEELLSHLDKEEQVLFPLIRAGGAPAEPIAVIEQEHAEAGDLLRCLRELAQDYSLPPNACASWRALWAGLERLEIELHEHIHLENNVLHPRAQSAGT